MRWTLALALAWAVCIAGLPAQQAGFNFQGRLLDSTGAPITAATVVRISLYRGGTADTADSGTLIYRETVSVTPDGTGIFNHVVGGAADAGFTYDPNLFRTTSAIFVQLNVPFDGDALLPRSQLVSVPYADQLAADMEAIPVPVLGARGLYNVAVAASDSNLDIIGVVLPRIDNLVAADANIPLGFAGGTPSLVLDAELHNASATTHAGQAAFFSFRLRGLESGASRTYEGTHVFTTDGPEIFTLPVVATTGNFRANEMATWTYQRRPNDPRDTLTADVMLHSAEIMINSTR
jgi:hypothetical protein